MNFINRSFLNLRELKQEMDYLPGVLQTEDKKEKANYFEDLIKDEELKKVTSKLFHNGHHARAVEEAYKFLNNLVKVKAEIDQTFDGSKLMKNVFSFNSPVLKLNAGSSVSEKDEQLGYMEIFSGCITGIRNPRAHEHEWEDTEIHALQLLVFADHLVDKVRRSSKAD